MAELSALVASLLSAAPAAPADPPATGRTRTALESLESLQSEAGLPADQHPALQSQSHRDEHDLLKAESQRPAEQKEHEAGKEVREAAGGATLNNSNLLAEEVLRTSSTSLSSNTPHVLYDSLLPCECVRKVRSHFSLVSYTNN